MKYLLIVLAVAISPNALSDETSHREKAAEFIRLGGTSEVAANTLAQLEEQLELQVDAMYETFIEEYFMSPDIAERLGDYEAEAREILREVFSVERFTSLIIPMYVANFSETELEQLIEFYKSPIGVAMNKRLPTIMQQSQAMGEQMAQEYIERMAPLNEQLNEDLGLVQ